MNKLLYLIFGISLFLVGCVHDEDDIFDLPATKRAEKLNADCKETLIDAQNGWVMEYFANTDKFGGFFMYLKFDEEQVEAFSESKPTEGVSSRYGFRIDNNAVLSFDLYNSVIHEYSDPKEDGNGYEGDFEFVIVSVSQDQIVLTGKKSNSRIYMNRLPEGKTFSQYLSDVKSMESYMNLKSLWLLVDGKDTLFIDGVGQRHFISSTDRTFTVDYLYSAALPTSDGIVFSPALKFKDKKYVSFKLADDKNSFVPVESQMVGKIVGSSPYNNFVDAITTNKMWTIVDQSDAMSAKVKSYYDVIKKSCDDKGRTMSVGFCFDNVSKKYAFRVNTIKGGSTVTGNFFYDFSHSDGIVAFSYTNQYDKNAETYWNSFNGFADFVKLVSASYKVAPAYSGLELTKVKLVSESDPELWFFVQEK